MGIMVSSQSLAEVGRMIPQSFLQTLLSYFAAEGLIFLAELA